MYTVTIEELERADGKPKLWACAVLEDGHTAFSSRSVSLRLRDESAARWLGELVVSLLADGTALPMISHQRTDKPLWEGDLDDDCHLDAGGHRAHVEWMSGPRRGGSWYCAVVSADGRRLFHTADFNTIQPKSGAAARWLCELIIQCGECGAIRGYAA